jgi:hypothetical protein
MSEQRDELSSKKIDAIYALRSAAEEKAQAEIAVDAQPTADARDALLDAQLRLEAKTQDAIEACHECGHGHPPGQPHYVDNLRRIDFSKPHGAE